MSDDAQGRHPLFVPVVFVGGLVFGVGLALSKMARPEVVLDFLQLQDFGLLFVMGGAALIAGPIIHLASWSRRSAPLTGRKFARRVKSMDRNVLFGGVVFGAGWGISGICPGAAYASFGVGNWPILYGIVGMFFGAYVQGVARDVVGGRSKSGVTES